jgi:hypothetical protein
MDVPAVRKRERLVAVRLGAEECADLIKDKAKPPGCDEGFEPSRGPVPLLNAPMVLLQMIVQVPVRPVCHTLPKDVPDGPRVGPTRGKLMEWTHPFIIGLR